MPDLTMLRGLTNEHTWRVRVAYEGNPGGPHVGTELVLSDAAPAYGTRFLGIYGWCTITSKRPTKLPPGLFQDQARAWQPRRRR